MQQIAKNVYTEDRFSLPTGKPGGYRGCNPSYVVTSAGVVVIDTPELPPDAVKMRDEVVQKGKVRYIINTHHHADHITGNFFFPGEVIAHEGTRRIFFRPLSEFTSLRTDAEMKEMEADGHGIENHIRRWVADEEPAGLALMKDYHVKIPSITFTDRLNLYVGEYTFELIHLPGHTESHIGVFVPEARVFFAGDNFTCQTQPSLAQSTPLEWVESLKKIETMDFDTIVPGHGKICGKLEVSGFRRFIEDSIALVKEAMDRGVSREQAAETISLENMHPGHGKSVAVHPGMDMQRRNIQRIYDALTGKRKPSF